MSAPVDRFSYVDEDDQGVPDDPDALCEFAIAMLDEGADEATVMARIHHVCAIRHLGADEVRVLTRIARRLGMGAKQYGALHVASDARDFGGKEAREEIEDSLVYFACAWLKREMAKGGGR